jgi:PleD family two-component response regulator
MAVASPEGGTLQAPEFSITVSIGCAIARPGMTSTALMAEADQALYVAKRNGRNRLEVFGMRGTLS